MIDIEAIARQIVDSAFHIARELGPGMVENVYETVLARDLKRQGRHVERQKYISFDYQGLWFENAFRLDIVVDSTIAIEVKSTRELRPEDYKQMLTYLNMAQLPLGFLINFGQVPIKIKRMVSRFRTAEGGGDFSVLV